MRWQAIARLGATSRAAPSRLPAAAIAMASLVARPWPAAAATFDCIIDPALSVKVGSPVPGVIGTISVDRGDRVKAGQELARLDSSVEAAALELGKARAADTSEIGAKYAKAALAESDYNRGRGLRSGEAISAQKLDELRSTLEVAKQELAQASLNRRLAQLEMERARALLEQRIIRSPADGIVTQRGIGPGEYIHETASVVTVASTDKLFVEAYPPVGFFGRVRVGQVATVHLAVPSEIDRAATVAVIDQVFDAASGSFGLRLVMPNVDDALPAGLRCQVTFPDALAYPLTAQR